MAAAIFLCYAKPNPNVAVHKRSLVWWEELKHKFDTLYCITYSQEDFTDLIGPNSKVEVVRIEPKQEKKLLEAFLQSLSPKDRHEVQSIVVFRQVMHKPAKILAKVFPAKLFELDLDDWDSLTYLSVLYGKFYLKKKRHLLFAPMELARIARSFLREIYFFPHFYSKIFLSCQEDRDRLNRFAKNKFFVRSNLLSIESPTKLPFPTLEEKCLFFVGSFEYLPNEDAVVWLIEKILPLLAKMPQLPPWRLILAGRRPLNPVLEKKIRALPYAELHLNAPDLAPLYQRASIVLVPIRLGGGTKLKTLEAFSYHRAVVSTKHGVRGLGATKDQHYKEANNSKEFALAIADLLLHPKLQENLADQSFALIEQKFAQTRR